MPRPSHSYNTSISQEKFPDHLKYSGVVRIFKNGDKPLIAHYRPIFLLTGFSKIYEILIYHRLNSAHTTTQYNSFSTVWFRKGSSMENATYQLIETVSYAWNSKKCIAGLFCDLTKPFF